VGWCKVEVGGVWGREVGRGFGVLVGMSGGGKRSDEGNINICPAPTEVRQKMEADLENGQRGEKGRTFVWNQRWIRVQKRGAWG